MIEKLSVRNFKSWKNLQDMAFGKVTALFGANSSGKTSLIQLLLALRQTLTSRDRRVFNFGGDSRDLVDLGSYIDAVHGHTSDRNIHLTISVALSNETQDKPEKTDRAEIEVVIGYRENQVIINEITYQTDSNSTLPLKRIKLVRLANGTYETQDQSATFSNIAAQLELEASGIYQAKFPKSALSTASEFEQLKLQVLESITLLASLMITTQLYQIYYLGPLRDSPHREYRWTGEKPASVGSKGEYAISALLSDLTSRRSNSSETHNLISQVNTWLKKLGLVDQVELSPMGDRSRVYEIVVKSSNYLHKANIADVGFGVSQVLPIVVLAHFVPEGSTIILEQPEIHLHPKVQAELADLFIEVALKRNVQFLIESHSEQLLNRLQKRLSEREGEFANLTDEDVRLYFCRREAEESILEPVQVDVLGNIANMPGEFYDPISPLIGTLKVDPTNGTTDLSKNHDYYISKERSHQLRDKDDDTDAIGYTKPE
ncbi:MAG: AAA family ATPase [Anaerolineae bacterium]|nr:AAA family ATPase [Anaerolineae bacterium]